jgi:hypothetical protein
MSLWLSKATVVARQLSLLSLREQLPNRSLAVVASGNQVVRSFAAKGGKKKISGAKKNSQNELRNSNSSKEFPREGEAATLQHQTWVNFQKSISVEGFETGQTVVVKSTKKTRGGQAARRRSKMSSFEAKLQERKRFTDVGGGRLPPMRYSEEETERLLTEAYANLPERAGKRGTRNLKRQANRWHLVRKIRKKYKHNLANFQIRKMEKRSDTIKQVKKVLADSPAIQQRDREYQLKILQRWAANMTLDVEEEAEEKLEEEQKAKI